ncbi:hypothetical protein GYB22_11405 [bacterium]|nr:hypothetical protein [bacterium]
MNYQTEKADSLKTHIDSADLQLGDKLKITPFRVETEVEIQGEFSDFQIINLYGHDMTSHVRILEREEGKINLDLSFLVSGMYIFSAANCFVQLVKL